MLARKHFKSLLQTFIVGNLLLLLPLRGEILVPLIIAGLFIYVRKTEHLLLKDSCMYLPEGIAARILVNLPLWIIIGRSFLHPMSYQIGVVISIIIIMYCIIDIKRYIQSAIFIQIAQLLGTLAAISIWLIVWEQFSITAEDQLSTFLPIAIILFLLSEQVSFYARFYRTMSAVLALFLTFAAMIDQQAYAPIFSIAAGILLTIAGIRYHEKISLFIGSLCVTGGFIFYWKYAANLYASAPLASSIGLGLVVILLASYIENKDRQILDKSRHYFNELKNWN